MSAIQMVGRILTLPFEYWTSVRHSDGYCIVEAASSILVPEKSALS